ncbi:hypothetical protein F0562_034197 [Nyssa sinensis]|uniref:Retrotransposon Copia-like N-terminal domain-containing protein n=1 Tax=Nyssa sinensis TaxID=561372 RepID=A0A5J5AFD7_9ASTE|nr:hypothetical protein F0562_034197 [Nyssa sinensis]
MTWSGVDGNEEKTVAAREKAEFGNNSGYEGVLSESMFEMEFLEEPSMASWASKEDLGRDWAMEGGREIVERCLGYGRPEMEPVLCEPLAVIQPEQDLTGIASSTLLFLEYTVSEEQGSFLSLTMSKVPECSGSIKPLISSNFPAITTVKLEGSNNYVSWAASVELWFMGQGYEDRLGKTSSEIDEKDKATWLKIDAQLCSLLWHSLDSKLLTLFQSCKTCYKVWTKAKNLYTNDVQRIYKVVYDIVHLQQNQQDMAGYLGQVETLRDEFNSLMPLSENIATQEKQRDKFFMVLALIGLRPDLSSVRNQILTSPTIPSLEDVFARLMRISSNTAPTGEIESSVLAVQTKHAGLQKDKRKGSKTHCTYCDKDGHTRDTCWALHGRPPRNNQSSNSRPAAHVAQTQGDGLLPLPEEGNQQYNSITLTGADYNEYLQYQAAKQHSSPGGTQSGKSFACLTKSPPLDPWILDSGASDHISGNKSHFSTLTST